MVSTTITVLLLVASSYPLQVYSAGILDYLDLVDPIAPWDFDTLLPNIVKHPRPFNINLFTRNLFPLIVEQNENVIFSPASIYTILALASLGAKGRTADEIRSVLQVDTINSEELATNYGNFLKTTFNKTKLVANGPQLLMANRLYVSNKMRISQQFNNLAQKHFDCIAENVNFSQPLTAAEKINRWVEEQTENKIRNLVQPDAVDQDTSAIMVNAIYFRAKWLHPFKKVNTHKRNFYLSRHNKTKVETMFTDGIFGYAELPSIRARALELPYNNSDISMLIILPDDFVTFETLEKRLRNIDLNEISSQLVETKMEVFLPKFHIEFDIDLKKPLKKLGCSSMFGSKADLSGLFEGLVPQQGISDIKHKAFLECDEDGSEAAAATFAEITFRSFYFKERFYVDHPFVFFVHKKNAVLFAGYVSNISQS